MEVDAAIQDERAVNLMSTQVMALVRHGKVSRLKDALAPIAKKKFDPAIVKVPYVEDFGTCLLYTSPSPRDQRGSRMPSSA